MYVLPLISQPAGLLGSTGDYMCQIKRRTQVSQAGKEVCFINTVFCKCINAAVKHTGEREEEEASASSADDGVTGTRGKVECHKIKTEI